MLGVVFWFLGVLIIRYGQPAGLLNGPVSAVTFAAIAASMWRAVRIPERLMSLTRSQSLAVVSIATATAVFCDVVVLGCVPGVYAPDAPRVLDGVILLFWGVGWALGLSGLRAANTP